jgi:hypothetical protein
MRRRRREKLDKTKCVRSQRLQNRTIFLIQVKVEQTNLIMSELRDQSLLTKQDDDIADISSSFVLDNNNTISLYNPEKMTSTIIEQFFLRVRRRRNDRVSLNQLKVKS